jgi:hypothetical protein
MNIVVFDMAQLAIARVTTPHGDALRVDLPNIGTLVEIPVVHEVSRREGVFRAMDAMLANLEMPSSDGRWCRVALYNPLTHQIAFEAVPRTKVYTDGLSLEIPLYGLPADVDDDGMTIGVRKLPRLVANASSTRSALASHSA